MLATLTDRRDFGDDWLLERKVRRRALAWPPDTAPTCASNPAPGRTSPATRGPRGAGGPESPRPRTRRRGGRVRRRSDVVQPASAAPRGHESHAGARGRVSGCLLRLRHPRGRRRGSRGPPLLERRARLKAAIRLSPAVQLTEAWRGDSQARFAEAHEAAELRECAFGECAASGHSLT